MAYGHTLTDDEKRELLRIARATLREFLSSGRIPPGAPHRESLRLPAGVFVSLHAQGELRGCVGQVQDSAPIYKAVQEMAIAAGSRDPRFAVVVPEELAELSFEISVLGERHPVKLPSDIQVGRDGLVLTVGPRRGLLLPQVARDQAWSAETFLGRVSEKAGLPPDAWRRPEALIEAFAAQVFDDKSHPAQAPLVPRRS